MTKIQWTEKTWNPTTGCSKVSEGCAHCYAEGVANRFWGDRKFTDVQFHPERLEQPLKRKKPTMYFVNSMSDLFHESVTDEQLDQVFAVMALSPQHTFQVLTKRPQRMMEYCDRLTSRSGAIALAAAIVRMDVQTQIKDRLVHSLKNDGATCLPLPNVWLGVTVESQRTANERIPLLLQTPAVVRFLSCEPLLEEVDILKYVNQGFGQPCPTGQGQRYLDWIIIGGESGPKSRPFDIAWARSLIRQCEDTYTKVFMKQVGNRPIMPCRTPDDPDWDSKGLIYRTTGKGGDPEEWPEDLRVREYPQGKALALAQ